MPTTVRISNRGKDILAQLSQEAHTTMTDVLDAALDSYRRQRFLEQASLAYASLPADSAADYHREMESLDTTSSDGLEPFAP
ncbi:MAG: hypothetical protein WC076_13330 [Terrimicrobiaceae bacterium]|nr:hypothetical protein [Terrimicrobiaceae bacterium]